MNITQLLFASRNKNKTAEIQSQLKDYNIKVKSLEDFDFPDVEETGLSFVENAIIKARSGCKHSALPCFADDSGLIVNDLKGAPGIYSARYAGPECKSKENINKLLAELESIPDSNRKARFCCVIVLMLHEHDPNPMIFESFWEGKILHEPTGKEGFGYDPVFWVPTYNCSAAELTPDVKNTISHRAQAVKKLKEALSRGLKL